MITSEPLQLGSNLNPAMSGQAVMSLLTSDCTCIYTPTRDYDPTLSPYCAFIYLWRFLGLILKYEIVSDSMRLYVQVTTQNLGGLA